MNDFWITTTSAHKQRIWHNLFGQERLPVKTAVPRWQIVPGRREAMLAYDLDTNRLHPCQVERLAAYVARRAGWPYEAALAEIRHSGWPIEAWHCHVEETETAVSHDTAVSLSAARKSSRRRLSIPLPIHIRPQLPQPLY